MSTPLAPPVSARTVTPVGETIKRMRIEKGWNEEEMAGRAGCSKKTVRSLEASKPCYVFTLTAFAKAFGLKDNALLVAGGGADGPQPRRDVEVEIKVRIPYDEFDQCEQLVRLVEVLRKLIEGGDIAVLGARASSTIITLEMNKAEGLRLLGANHKLRDHDAELLSMVVHDAGTVFEVQVVNDFGIVKFSKETWDSGCQNFVAVMKELPFNHLIIDVAELRYASLDIIKRFLLFKKWATANGRHVVWCNLREGVAEAFALAGFDPTNVRADVSDALRWKP